MLNNLLKLFFTQVEPSKPKTETFSPSPTNSQQPEISIKVEPSTPQEGTWDRELGTYVNDKTPGYVYIACIRPGELYKFGMTTNLTKRLTQLKKQYRQNSLHYVYYKQFEKPFRLEQELIAKYSAHRKYELYPELIGLSFSDLKNAKGYLSNKNPNTHANTNYFTWRNELIKRHRVIA